MDDGKRLQFEGKWDQVVGSIKEKTGENTEEIERRLHDMMDQ
jgi:uncharacterized protein YjbJ (UPF0337 family)